MYYCTFNTRQWLSPPAMPSGPMVCRSKSTYTQSKIILWNCLHYFCLNIAYLYTPFLHYVLKKLMRDKRLIDFQDRRRLIQQFLCVGIRLENIQLRYILSFSPRKLHTGQVTRRCLGRSQKCNPTRKPVLFAFQSCFRNVVWCFSKEQEESKEVVRMSC